MEEIIEKRRECSKVFDRGKGIQRIEAYTGPMHYKDHYDDPEEQWKDIDLTWQANKITKAPYILVHDDKVITITNKKTGEVHSLELLDNSKLRWERTRGLARARLEGETVEVIAGRAFVRFRRRIKNADHPLISKFRLEGDPKKMRFLASDPGGALSVEHSIKDGILIETVNPKRALKFPVRIDPTIDEYEVAASTDDVFYCDLGSGNYWRDFIHVGAGYQAQDVPEFPPVLLSSAGCGMRFIDIDIEPNSIIHAAFLTLRASVSRDGMIRSEILVESDPDPATYPATMDEFLVRRQNTPTTGVYWDFDTSWVKGQDYDSPDFAWQVQYLIEDPDWVALNAISVFWDDLKHRTGVGAHRLAYSWDAANP